MIHSPCNQCGQEATYPDVFGGQKLKCKHCPDGWVTLPPRAGVAYLEPPMVVRPPQPMPQPSALIEREPDSPSEWKSQFQPAGPTEFTEEERKHLDFYGTTYMLSLGIGAIGVASLVLHLFGWQFKRLAFLEQHQPFAAIMMIVLGIPGVIFMSWFKRRQQM